MRRKHESTAMIGVGVAACAACCAGPILGVLAAIGVGTTAGFALFGTGALVVGAAAAAVVAVRRRRRPATCAPVAPGGAMPVELTAKRTPREGLA